MKNKNRFDFISDPGHGWLAVPRGLVAKLGIAGEITPYSYQQGETLYLEEDQDANTFIQAFKARYGDHPEIREEIICNGRSRIRGMQPYKVRKKELRGG